MSQQTDLRVYCVGGDLREITLPSHYSFVFGIVPLGLPWLNSSHRLRTRSFWKSLLRKKLSLQTTSQTSSMKNLNRIFHLYVPSTTVGLRGSWSRNCFRESLHSSSPVVVRRQATPFVIERKWALSRTTVAIGLTSKSGTDTRLSFLLSQISGNPDLGNVVELFMWISDVVTFVTH